MGVKMNLRIITKNHAADPEKGVSQKIDFKAQRPRDGHADSVRVNTPTLTHSFQLERRFDLHCKAKIKEYLAGSRRMFRTISSLNYASSSETSSW